MRRRELPERHGDPRLQAGVGFEFGMSEYQVYEFASVDRPLTVNEIASLRAISSRAEISATRFWNEYSWGDLKANPSNLLETFFDAHLYYANWGGHRLMLRIPIDRVDLVALREYFPGGATTCRTVGKHVIVDVRPEDEPDDYDFRANWSLAAFLPLRVELMQGDMRGAYLAWLLSVAKGETGDEEREPPVPPGLSDRTPAEEALIDFFEIDRDLLAAAADGSDEILDERDELRRWVAALSVVEKEAWLARAVDDPNVALGGEMLRTFRAERPVTTLRSEHSIHPVLVAGIAQFQLVHIHPFVDGNGRTSRLLSTLCLYRAGYDFKRLFTISEYYDRDRAAFYAAIQNVRTVDMDLTGWLSYFVAGLATQLQEVRARGERAIRADVLARDRGLNERQAILVGALLEHASVTLADAEHLLRDVTRRTVQRDLKRLVELGLVIEVGSGPTDPNRAYRWAQPKL